MNKQEAIEILEQERNLLKAGDPDSTVWNAEGWAKHIYARIAPLFEREFPEEDVDRIVCRLLGEGSGQPGYTAPTISSGVVDFKHLWEGQAPELNLDQGLIDTKGSCPRCGGDGERKEGPIFSGAKSVDMWDGATRIMGLNTPEPSPKAETHERG